MALTKINDRGLKTPIDLLDNEKIRFGTGDDLQIYHTGSLSYIQDTGTGHLVLSGSKVQMTNAADSEGMFMATEDGSVDLYYNGVKKFETDPNGVLQGDNSWHYWGDSDDLYIGHNGTNSFIVNTTGALYLRTGTGLNLQNSGGTETYLYTEENGAVFLRYDNVTKFETTSDGVNVTGHLDLNSDTGKLKLGAGDDLSLYHDGSNSYIVNTGGSLRIWSKAGEYAIEATPDGAVDLYYDNSKKLSTVSTGVKIENAGNNRVLKLDHTDGDHCYITFMDDDTSDDGQVRVGALNNDLLFLAGGSERLRIESGGNIRLLSENGNNSDTPGIYFRGGDSSQKANFAKIHSRMVSNWGGQLQFKVKDDNGSLSDAYQTAMIMNHNGHVTTPNQPCSMYRSLSNSSTNGATNSTETLVFTDAKLDKGSHYDTSNGRFTAPVAGRYFVGHNCLIDNNASDSTRSADLQINGSGYVTLWYDESGGDNDYHGVSGTAIVQLAVGDYISIRATSGIHDGSETSFTVYLLG